MIAQAILRISVSVFDNNILLGEERYGIIEIIGRVQTRLCTR